MKNTKKVVAEFKRKLSTEVRKQEKLDLTEEQDFWREELSGKYTAKMLYRWDNGKFEKEYLKMLERN